MRDRQPTKVLENGALRYGVYDETGALLRYEYLALEDAPSDVGTDLSKANLLTDDTETALFGDATDRTVNDALASIAGQLKLIMDDVAAITVTLQDSAGAAIPGVLVQGILSENGQSVYSNSSGVASGYISEGSQPIKVTGYADIADYSETISVTKGTSITKTITLTTRNFLKITSSKSVKFSGNVESIDISLVGGGGGGQEAEWWQVERPYGGGGGGGGYVMFETGLIPTPEQPYSAVIGAGGNAITSREGEGAGMGGTTSFMGKTASGGNGAGGWRTYNSTFWCGSFGGEGGSKGGNGAWNTKGPGVNGSNATGSFYTSFSTVGPAGGSGGGGYYASTDDGWYSAGNGGSGGGGNGGMSSNDYGSSPQNASPGTDGLGGGGGGGSLYYDGDNYKNTQGGKGGSGGVAIRMHLKSAA